MEAEKLVTTTLGNIPESSLQFTTMDSDEGDVLIVAREWTYVGDDPALAEHKGTVVRRDVWATIKCGQAAQAVSEL